MKIEVQHLDRKKEIVNFENALWIIIGGIKIQIIEGGIKLISDESIIIEPKSSNLIIIKEKV